MSKVFSVYAGFVGHDGVPTLLSEGDEYEADHSLVLAHPELFTEPEPVKAQAKPVATKPTAAKGKAAAKEPDA